MPDAVERSRTPGPVLLVSSNGSGMGHLTRLLAYGSRLPDGVDLHVLSLSQAVPAVEQFGVSWEYLPSAGATGMSQPTWRDLFTARMLEVFDRVAPSVVVFDGTNPYPGIDTALAAFPDVASIWSRRGMWRPGLGADALAKAAWFDGVIEPGDLAAPADRGATASSTANLVGPVTLLDRDDLDDRAHARADLGLRADGRAALVTLGAGNLNDTASDVACAVLALQRRGYQVAVTKTLISSEDATEAPHTVSQFPLSRHFAAFDLAISAAGYNSFHELLRFGVPTLFVPNRATQLDDQVARATYAEQRGWALAVDSLDPASIDALLDDLEEGSERRVAAAREADPGNGAQDAADLIASMTGAR